MSEDTAPIVVTLKAGTDYSAPWLVIRGYDPDDVTNKLKNLDGVIEATLEAAGIFAAGRSLGQPTQTAPAQQAPAEQPKKAWGGNPQPQAAPAPQGNGGGYQPHPSAVLHPEGKTCDLCGQPLEFKKTQTGKATWRCGQWRWANGNPNGHASEFID